LGFFDGPELNCVRQEIKQDILNLSKSPELNAIQSKGEEMKKSVLLMAMLIGAFLDPNLLAFSKPESKKWDGFRNFEWGVHIADINDPCMVIDPEPRTEKDVLICMKKDEKLSIGKADICGIRYYFYQGLLYEVKIVVKKKNSYELLKQEIFARFGEGEKQFAIGEMYIWNSRMTNGKVSLGLGYFRNNLGIFDMVYLPIFKKKEEAQKRDEAKLKKWEGFRNLRWNMRIEDVNDPNLTGDHIPRYNSVEKDVLYYYEEKDEKLSIGDAKLSGILYYFYKGRFYKVEIATIGQHDYETLKRAIFALFGKGKKEEDVYGGEIYTWSPDMTDGNVLMLLTFEEGAFINNGKFTMMYVPILKEMEMDKEKAAKDAARDF
jgi:hypothetical protein